MLATLYFATVPLWAQLALKLSFPGSFTSVPLSLLLVFLPISALVYSVKTGMHDWETQAARNLFGGALTVFLCQSFVIFPTIVLVAPAAATQSNLGGMALIRTALGVWGLSLLLSLVLDPRLAGSLSSVAILVPFLVDSSSAPLGEIWGFALAPDASQMSWVVSGMLFAGGVIFHLIQTTRKTASMI